ncbi:nuclear transport factor 2 family protein [Paenibacillus hunanensis]|uniref:nuclear transport factor 2 family protein n=1 Tax=Paenibacillus hunanensis TaxID=539262 RepID=UPI002A6A96C7|nr:nuclear transport factor 2 family protein [Paenibacillus hunanensis]WPP41193.1 nuclear transport factor 2 family protein [Paenibacillus hunanensis]
MNSSTNQTSIATLQQQQEKAAVLMNRFTTLLLEQKREEWLDLFDEKVIFEFPYVRPADANRVEGKQALAEHMRYFDTIIAMKSMSEPLIHQTLQPHVFIAQFQGRGQLLQTGQVYDQNYISVIEVKDGRIIRYEDYWNPLAVTVD